jgi:putative peptide zinc metalloprotease protein
MGREDKKTFHESWYRIADQRICLRRDVKARRQMYRGRRWYVLFDPFNNEFFRLSPNAYEFVVRLNMNRTVEQVWEETLTRDAANAPGQEEVIHLLAQLYHANLLHYEMPADSERLFERYRKRRQRILQASFQNIMFMRIPLLDPDEFIRRCLPAVRWLISPLGAAIWLLVVAAAVKVGIDHASELWQQTQGILAPSNLFLLYVGLVVAKALHEFGHAFICRRFGGEVHTMGVMFLIFSPIPYMDATSAWAFRSKWKRALVGAAGMVTELFVAALAMFVWAGTGPGVIHTLAYNMVFVASVSTIVFNINPLLRFDGYYILSDLLDIPNLHAQAFLQLRHLVERYAFGCKKSESQAGSRREAAWLTLFGITSGIYRVVVFGGILVFVADRFLLAGIIMAAVCLVAWVLAPAGALIRYLATSPRLERARLRAVLVSVSTVALILGFLYFCPFPSSIRAPGVIEAAAHTMVVNTVEGQVTEVLAPSEATVKAGDPLVRMANGELDLELARMEAIRDETLARRTQAMQERQADIRPLESRISAIEERLANLRKKQDELVVRAGIDGMWISPHAAERKGMFIPRGTSLGQIVDTRSLFFSAVVSQDESFHFFAGKVRSSEVKLAGQSEVSVPVVRCDVIPAEQTTLPSLALGWRGGGDVAVDVRDSGGVRTAEPFYQVRALLSGHTPAALFHGRSGRVRFQLVPEPLLRQWGRAFRQLLQKRYQL